MKKKTLAAVVLALAVVTAPAFSGAVYADEVVSPIGAPSAPPSGCVGDCPPDSSGDPTAGSDVSTDVPPSDTSGDTSGSTPAGSGDTSGSTPAGSGDTTPTPTPTPEPTSDDTSVVDPAVGLDVTLDLAVGDFVEGATVAVNGARMLVGSPWDFTVRSTPKTLVSGKVGVAGTVNATAAIPAGLEAGWHTLTLMGTSADGGIFKRVVRFEVGSDGRLASAVQVLALEAVPAALASTGTETALPLGLGILALLAGTTLMVFRRKRVTA